MARNWQSASCRFRATHGNSDDTDACRFDRLLFLGKSFLDIGCGSGLFSHAARRLGARVHSCDFDAHSVVACADELRRRYFQGGVGLGGKEFVFERIQTQGQS